MLRGLSSCRLRCAPLRTNPPRDVTSRFGQSLPPSICTGGGSLILRQHSLSSTFYLQSRAVAGRSESCLIGHPRAMYSSSSHGSTDPPRRGRGRPKGSKNKSSRRGTEGEETSLSKKLLAKHQRAWEEAGAAGVATSKGGPSADGKMGARGSGKLGKPGSTRKSKGRKQSLGGADAGFEQFLVRNLSPEQLEQYKYVKKRSEERAQAARQAEKEALAVQKEIRRSVKEEQKLNSSGTGALTAPAAAPFTLRTVVEQLKEDKAKHVVVLDVRDCCQFAQYIIICEGNSSRHMRALSDHVLDLQELRLRRRGLAASTPLTVEGRENQDWMIVDCGDIVVNVMSRRARLYYDMESMWVLKGAGRGSPEIPEWAVIEQEEEEEIPNIAGWHPLDNDMRRNAKE